MVPCSAPAFTVDLDLFITCVIIALFLLELRKRPRVPLTMAFGAATRGHPELGTRKGIQGSSQKTKNSIKASCQFPLCLVKLVLFLDLTFPSSKAHEPPADCNLVEVRLPSLSAGEQAFVQEPTSLNYFLWSVLSSPFCSPFPQPGEDLTSAPQCLHSASVEDSRSRLGVRLFPCLSSPAAASSRADTITDKQRCTHLLCVHALMYVRVCVFSFSWVNKLT